MTLMWSDSANNGHLVVAGPPEFIDARRDISRRLLSTTPFNAGKWQQLDISESDAHRTYELLNVGMWYQMPQTIDDAMRFIQPDLPWAENHFWERVGGEPINPGVEHNNWPYHAGNVELHQHGGKYDHNYMERIWPKKLEFETAQGDFGDAAFMGYRFHVGDLSDVVQLLATERGTRQAYLPIWFPEDTGATAGQRVPCTLGYHFIVRDGQLHVQYNLRSCEIYRHFTNDVYMAVRLAQWVADQMFEKFETDFVSMGQLTMNIVSMHGFVGDTPKIEEMA